APRLRVGRAARNRARRDRRVRARRAPARPRHVPLGGERSLGESVGVTGATFDFGGASVLVTGGPSGIGLAIARAFRASGARVTVTGTRADADEYEVDLGA